MEPIEPLKRRNCISDEGNKMPEGQGKRDVIRPRHDLIPIEFLDELASIFEEGRKSRPGMPEGYGESWRKGGSDFTRDCLNHASNHLHLYMNGDRDENHMAKVAWNCLVVKFHAAYPNSPKINYGGDHKYESQSHSMFPDVNCRICGLDRSHHQLL